MLIGYVRVSKSDGSQTLAPQRDALLAAGVSSERIYQDLASGNTMPALLLAALFYDLTPEKTVTISSQSERRERDLQELFRRAKKPVALFIDDAHDLHPKTLTALKRLTELVAEGGGQLSIVLIGHPKLRTTCAGRRWRRSATAPRCSSSAGCATGSATISIG